MLSFAFSTMASLASMPSSVSATLVDWVTIADINALAAASGGIRSDVALNRCAAERIRNGYVAFILRRQVRQLIADYNASAHAWLLACDDLVNFAPHDGYQTGQPILNVRFALPMSPSLAFFSTGTALSWIVRWSSLQSCADRRACLRTRGAFADTSLNCFIGAGIFRMATR